MKTWHTKTLAGRRSFILSVNFDQGQADLPVD